MTLTLAARSRSFPKRSSYSTASPIESPRISFPSSEDRSKYASQPSSPRTKPQPIFLFSRVMEPRISALSFPLAELQFASRFYRYIRLSLCMRFSPSAMDALPRPLCQASPSESDSSRADPRKAPGIPLRVTLTFGRVLVLHHRHESCLSPGFDRRARSLPSCIHSRVFPKIRARFLSLTRGRAPRPPSQERAARKRCPICEHLQMPGKIFSAYEAAPICSSMSRTPTRWLLKISLATSRSRNKVLSETE